MALHSVKLQMLFIQVLSVLKMLIIMHLMNPAVLIIIKFFKTVSQKMEFDNLLMLQIYQRESLWQLLRCFNFCMHIINRKVPLMSMMLLQEENNSAVKNHVYQQHQITVLARETHHKVHQEKEQHPVINLIFIKT